jgi:pimeloyl-ACP methyl ester carboxylesterase
VKREQDLPVELGRVELDGHSIAYRSSGAGDALVLLHGFLCDSRVWQRQLEDLADVFRVVAWDAPGAGSSSDPTPPFAITDWARCLAEFLDAVEVSRAHIAGLSWGGLLAQELYRLDAARVATLVLAGTYTGWRGSFGPEVAAQRLLRCERESTLDADEFVRLWVPHEFFAGTAADGVREQMAAVVRDFHPLGFRLMARSLAETDTTELLRTIAVPVLLLWGDGDLRSPLSVATHFHDAIPGSELAIIAGAGHVSNMERPEAFTAQLRRFCSSHPIT